MNFINITNFCSAKSSVKRMRKEATDWEKKFTKDAPNSGLLSKIHQELLKLNNKKTNSLIKK